MSFPFPSQVAICVQNHFKPHTLRAFTRSSPLSIAKPMNSVVHVSDIFPFKLVVRDSYRLERHEGRLTLRRIRSSKGGLIEDVW